MAVLGVILSTFFGVIVGVGSLFFGRQILLLTQCTEEIFAYAVPYFMEVPSVFLSVSLTLSACLRGEKRYENTDDILFFVQYS